MSDWGLRNIWKKPWRAVRPPLSGTVDGSLAEKCGQGFYDCAGIPNANFGVNDGIADARHNVSPTSSVMMTRGCTLFCSVLIAVAVAVTQPFFPDEC